MRFSLPIKMMKDSAAQTNLRAIESFINRILSGSDSFTVATLRSADGTHTVQLRCSDVGGLQKSLDGGTWTTF